VQHYCEKCLVDFDFAVVLDETHLSELVHEKGYPGTRCANHFGKRLLRYLWQHSFGLMFLRQDFHVFGNLYPVIFPNDFHKEAFSLDQWEGGQITSVCIIGHAPEQLFLIHLPTKQYENER
jgi:hypothetical protein